MTSSTDFSPSDTVCVGVISGSHGVRGEIKIKPETNSPEFLLRFGRFIVRGETLRALSLRVHAGNLLASLERIDSRYKADALRGERILAYKADARLPEGEYFVGEILGFQAIDEESGGPFGIISDYLDLPGHAVWVISLPESGEKLIPANREFVKHIDTAAGTVRFRLIEGL